MGAPHHAHRLNSGSAGPRDGQPPTPAQMGCAPFKIHWRDCVPLCRIQPWPWSSGPAAIPKTMELLHLSWESLPCSKFFTNHLQEHKNTRPTFLPSVWKGHKTSALEQWLPLLWVLLLKENLYVFVSLTFDICCANGSKCPDNKKEIKSKCMKALDKSPFWK